MPQQKHAFFRSKLNRFAYPTICAEELALAADTFIALSHRGLL